MTYKLTEGCDAICDLGSAINLNKCYPFRKKVRIRIFVSLGISYLKRRKKVVPLMLNSFLTIAFKTGEKVGNWIWWLSWKLTFCCIFSFLKIHSKSCIHFPESYAIPPNLNLGLLLFLSHSPKKKKLRNAINIDMLKFMSFKIPLNAGR